MFLPMPGSLVMILLVTAAILLARHLLRGGSVPLPSFGRLGSSGGGGGKDHESRGPSWEPEEWVEGYPRGRRPPPPNWGTWPDDVDERWDGF